MDLYDIVFVEKYRPRNFDELVTEHKSLILNLLKSPGSMPSLLLHSAKPGTGKTSCAKLIAKELKADYLKINASDERGIDTIREKVKNFAQALSSNPNCKRVIFLDEAEGLCLDENTEVVTIEGDKEKIFKIKDLVNKDIKVYSYDNETSSIIIDSAVGIDSGWIDMYEIQLEDGRKIVCSAKHPFFEQDSLQKDKINEKKLYDLKEGCEIIDFKEELPLLQKRFST